MRTSNSRWPVLFVALTTSFLACGGEESGCDNPYAVSADGELAKVHFRFEGQYLAGEYDLAQAPVTPHEWIAIHANLIDWDAEATHPALQFQLWPGKEAEASDSPDTSEPKCDENGCTARVRTHGSGDYLLTTLQGAVLADLLALHFEPIAGMELLVEGPIASGTYGPDDTAPIAACVGRGVVLDFLPLTAAGRRMVGIPDVCIRSDAADLFNPFLAAAGSRSGDTWRLVTPEDNPGAVGRTLIFKQTGTFTLDAAFCNAPEIHREFQVAVEAAGAACDASYGDNSIFSAE